LRLYTALHYRRRDIATLPRACRIWGCGERWSLEWYVPGSRSLISLSEWRHWRKQDARLLDMQFLRIAIGAVLPLNEGTYMRLHDSYGVERTKARNRMAQWFTARLPGRSSREEYAAEVDGDSSIAGVRLERRALQEWYTRSLVSLFSRRIFHSEDVSSSGISRQDANTEDAGTVPEARYPRGPNSALLIRRNSQFCRSLLIVAVHWAAERLTGKKVCRAKPR
jgi:hypothetical protein